MNKTKIKAEIVAHSLSPQGDELISVLCTFPRIILAEVNTHRMLSKNTSSSRAIPFTKMVESVQNDPFIPIAWQKEHTGMQGYEYFTDSVEIEGCKKLWLEGRDKAIEVSLSLNNGEFIGVTKQLCNRLLEPFMWTTMLITGSKEGWDNFFELRCPKYGGIDARNNEVYFKSKKDAIKHLQELRVNTINLKEDDILGWLQINKGQAEIHIMDLAEKIYDAMNESTPIQLKAGEWHIPFEDKMDDNKIEYLVSEGFVRGKGGYTALNYQDKNNINNVKVQISTAMAARTSYTVVGEEKEVDYSKMIELHDRLLSQNPPHSSPLEHCARAMSDEEYYTFVKGRIIEENKRENGTCDSLNWVEASGWCNNLKGFIPYRYFIDNKIEL